MREFKFRIWDMEAKCFVSQYENTPRENRLKFFIDCNGNLGKLIYPLEEEYAGTEDNLVYPENYVVQQYIGLKDLKGNEVYEGDIIESNWATDCKYRCKVTFEFGAFILETKGGGTLQDSYYTITHGVVIGNILENPELL
jgi:uncharacterized phage protein (TIGR01671 family)